MASAFASAVALCSDRSSRVWRIDDGAGLLLSDFRRCRVFDLGISIQRGVHQNLWAKLLLYGTALCLPHDLDAGRATIQYRRLAWEKTYFRSSRSLLDGLPP